MLPDAGLVHRVLQAHSIRAEARLRSFYDESVFARVIYDNWQKSVGLQGGKKVFMNGIYGN